MTGLVAIPPDNYSVCLMVVDGCSSTSNWSSPEVLGWIAALDHHVLRC